MEHSFVNALKRLKRASLPLLGVVSAVLVVAGPSSAGAQSQSTAEHQANRAALVLADAQVVAPPSGGRVPNLGPLVLRWAGSDAAVVDWEVQVSGDGRFDLDPATATSPVQAGVVHEPAWPLAQLEPCRAYFWRVRPVAGEGVPAAEWSTTWSFSTAGAGPVPGKIAFIYHYQGVPIGERPPSYDELYLMNADGSGRTPLAMAEPYAPSWSPDGCIAFSRGGTLHTLTPDGQVRTLPGDGQGGFFGKSAWSPDGTRLAFAHAPAASAPSEIYVANADGTGMTRLTQTGGNDAPAWLPDGKRIVFQGMEPGAAFGSLFVMNADGTGMARLATGGDPAPVAGSDTEPAWSPNGTKVAFTSGRNGASLLYLMNADGSGVTPLTEDGGDHAAWSADGSQILFHSLRGGQHGGAIWTMGVDGSNQRQLSSLGSLAVTAVEEGDALPAWAPQPR